MYVFQNDADPGKIPSFIQQIIPEFLKFANVLGVKDLSVIKTESLTSVTLNEKNKTMKK